MKRGSFAVALRTACVFMIVLAACRTAEAQEAQQRVKSWIYIDHSCACRTYIEGDSLEVPVDYYLDPGEDKGGTLLTLWGGGPWIDNPDGKYVQDRHHVSYPGLWASAPVASGRGHHVFKLTVPPALPQNGILLIVRFKDASGRDWPWDFRRGGIWFARRGGSFELETGKPGNLFTYDEPVRIVARLRNVTTPGAQMTLGYKVTDAAGAVVAQGQVPFTVQQDGQEVPIALDLSRRGTFLIEAGVPGWETRDTTFCRIPDLMAITGGARTQFGMTNVVVPAPPERLNELCMVARRLGLTSCRAMYSWYDMEPGPGVYMLDAWEQVLEIGRRNGIDTWLCVYEPPAWAFSGPLGTTSYAAVRVDWDAWRDFVHTVSTRLKGKLYGWEWLNEITPGGTSDPVTDYLTMCRIATQTAKAADPNLVTILAGGLWPRSFRTEMLKAGVADYIDALPIHYSDGAGVREAREDLESVGAAHVAVWDDESASGLNAWSVPPLEELRNTSQCDWVLTRWPDELTAGCERIIYFGGEGAPAGNWTYLLGDLRPRPVAATLAVFTSKMFSAKPVGVFSLGRAGLCHLFERGGSPLLVCSRRGGAETVSLPVGADSLRLTDYQGNESIVPAPDGVAALELTTVPFFAEGADLNVLRAYAVPEVLPYQGAEKARQRTEAPRLTMLAGRPGSVLVRLRNTYDRRLEGTVRIELPAGWPPAAPVPFGLEPAEERILPVTVAAPAGASREDQPGEAVFAFAWDKLPQVRKPFAVSVLSPTMLGNLLRNGGFEQADAAGTGPDSWPVDGKTSQWADAEGLGLGLGKRVVRFANSSDYSGIGQTLDLPGGRTYLYTAWVWNHDMPAGSNVYLEKADGSTEALYDIQVFKVAESTPYWQVYTSRVNTPGNLKRAGFAPLARGPGWALFDNVRVTLFEGTDFAAECHKAPRPPRIDGKLDDWVTQCPIPLVGRNQLTVVQDGYKWTPQNLNGVAYLMYDEANLYVAVEVLDDVEHTVGPDDAVVQGDSLILALDPTNRGPEAAARAFAYYVSSAPPGGGSGRHTIYRPASHAGGLRTGHLFRDSSVYEMAVERSPGRCTYEIRIPLSELGGVTAAPGGKFAFSIQLNDNDGAGLAAHMNWGGGISPAWRPEGFGVVTFAEEYGPSPGP